INDTFNWDGGQVTGGSVLNPIQLNSTLNISGSGTKYLAAYVTNNGVINHAGTGDVSLSGGLTNVGTYDLQGDAGWGAPSLQEFLNQGVLRKSDGSGTATWGGFRNVGGTVDVHSGTLHLEFVGESTGLAVNVDTDATVTLEDGYGGLSGTFIGTYS